MQNEMSISSLTITFNPDLKQNTLMEQLQSLSHHHIPTYIVDNCSENIDEITRLSRSISNSIIILKLTSNMGLAGALNFGIEYIMKTAQSDWILTLDQDTTFYSDSIEKMLDCIQENDDPRIALFGFNYERLRFSKKSTFNKKDGTPFVEFAITSGSIVNRQVYGHIRYDKSLFIYFLDYDFCRKILKSKLKIFICPKAFMIHQEGKSLIKNSQEFFYLDPERLYYLVRNAIIVSWKYRTISPLLYVALVIFENIIAGVSIFKLTRYIAKGFLGIIK